VKDAEFLLVLLIASVSFLFYPLALGAVMNIRYFLETGELSFWLTGCHGRRKVETPPISPNYFQQAFA